MKMILVMNQIMRVNHGKITNMRNISQIKNWRLYYEKFSKKIQCGILVIEKLGLTSRIMFILCIVDVVKFTNHGWRKKTYYPS